MRSKEEAHDYRYFPEPDLPPLAITREYVEELRRRLPELPESRRERFLSEYGLSPYEAELLTESRSRADFYEAAVKAAGGGRRAKLVSNWFLSDFARHLNAAGIEASESKVRPEQLASLVVMVDEGKLNGAAAKRVLEEMFAGGGDPVQIVRERGLGVMEDEGAILEAVRKVIAENAKVVEDYKSGKPGAINALVGPVMRETRGRANARRVQELLEAELKG
jgi:aspartyl-tRNA(Asn)/glutamyl-tRNA(Gln) amidotransferase subunit B